jgi:hypothetical protein
VGITLLRPSRKGEKPHGGERFFKPLPQTIKSIFDTLKASRPWSNMVDGPSPASAPASVSASLP